MSRVGEWKTGDGRTMQITAMEDSHLRNSLRMYYRKLLPPTPSASDIWLPQTLTPRPATVASSSALTYYRNKFIELGAEAQRRNWIPNNTTYEQLFDIVGGWQTEWEQNRNNYRQPRVVPVAEVPNIIVLDTSIIFPYVDVVGAVNNIVRERIITKRRKKEEKTERLLSFDL